MTLTRIEELVKTLDKVEVNADEKFGLDLVRRADTPLDGTAPMCLYGYGSYAPYMGLNKLVMPEEEARMGLKNTCILPKSEGFDYDVYISTFTHVGTTIKVSPDGEEEEKPSPVDEHLEEAEHILLDYVALMRSNNLATVGK